MAQKFARCFRHLPAKQALEGLKLLRSCTAGNFEYLFSFQLFCEFFNIPSYQTISFLVNNNNRSILLRTFCIFLASFFIFQDAFKLLHFLKISVSTKCSVLLEFVSSFRPFSAQFPAFLSTFWRSPTLPGNLEQKTFCPLDQSSPNILRSDPRIYRKRPFQSMCRLSRRGLLQLL